MDNNKFHCKCFTKESKTIIGEVDTAHHPYKHVDCDIVKEPYMDSFDADTNLITFLGSTLGLKTSLGQDNDIQERPNICNQNRVVNIATLYLAQSLGLSTLTLVETYTYVTSATHVFPMPKKGGPKNTYIPDNLPDFPDLEQAFWTILNQYTPATEINIRRDKSNLWCWYVGNLVHIRKCSSLRVGTTYSFVLNSKLEKIMSRSSSTNYSNEL